jgi:hypothetical protein
VQALGEQVEPRIELPEDLFGKRRPAATREAQQPPERQQRPVEAAVRALARLQSELSRPRLIDLQTLYRSPRAGETSPHAPALEGIDPMRCRFPRPPPRHTDDEILAEPASATPGLLRRCGSLRPQRANVHPRRSSIWTWNRPSARGLSPGGSSARSPGQPAVRDELGVPAARTERRIGGGSLQSLIWPRWLLSAAPKAVPDGPIGEPPRARRGRRGGAVVSSGVSRRWLTGRKLATVHRLSEAAQHMVGSPCMVGLPVSVRERLEEGGAVRPDGSVDAPSTLS